jgi:hypothetical protein
MSVKEMIVKKSNLNFKKPLLLGQTSFDFGTPGDSGDHPGPPPPKKNGNVLATAKIFWTVLIQTTRKRDLCLPRWDPRSKNKIKNEKEKKGKKWAFQTHPGIW